VAVIPVPAGEKNPGRFGWEALRITEEEIPNYWTNGQNIGVLVGEPSGWRVDVDLDADEAVTIAGRFLPPTLTSGRMSRPHSHWWYIASEAVTQDWSGPDREKQTDVKLVELRSTGRQTLVAPSTHPDGDSYIWHSGSGLEPAEITADELAARCRELATATFIARRVPPVGRRHDFALALAGFLLRPGRLDEGLALKILNAAWHAAEADSREAVRGKSTAAGVLALHEALVSPGALVLILAPAERQAKELFSKVATAYQFLGHIIPADSYRRMGMELANGSRIKALPGSERTIRGFSGVDLLLVDEASRVTDELYYAVRPMLAVSGGHLMMLTTPYGGVGFSSRNGPGTGRGSATRSLLASVRVSPPSS